MSGIHQKVKFGDLIYLEIEDKCRYSLSSPGFSLKKRSQIEVNRIFLPNNNVFLRDFENNLFVIFPPMPEKFLTNKVILDDCINLLSQKLEFAPNLLNEIDSKKDMNTIITTFKDLKKEVYHHNSFLRDSLISKSIKFGDNFILIHLRSQMLVHTINIDNSTDKENNKIILSENYSDDCIFHFYPYNKYDKDESEVFCNQSIFIRKSEKNIWANNPYLYYLDSTLSDVNRKREQARILSKNAKRPRCNVVNNKLKTANIVQTKTFTLLFTEDQEAAKPFQVKICSKYIDPSSLNLSFSNPFWIVCQSLDKYLIIKPVSKSETNSHLSFFSNNTSPNQSLLGNETTHNVISFASIDQDKTINNIYGLFNVEQVEASFLLNGSDIRMSPYIEFNKVIRFRHVASKKYLAFIKKEVNVPVESNRDRENNPNNDQLYSDKRKTFGTLVLKDVPDDDCEWMFMESYKILNRLIYEKAKLEGIGNPRRKLLDMVKDNPRTNPDNKNSDEKDKDNKTSDTKTSEDNPDNLHNKSIVKKKDILRIFHLKSMKFMSFEDVVGMSERELHNAADNQEKPERHTLSLNKLPLDNDLIRLLPSNESQSWEIHLILFFYETLDELVHKCIKNDFRLLLKSDNSNNMNTIQEEKEELDFDKFGEKEIDKIAKCDNIDDRSNKVNINKNVNIMFSVRKLNSLNNKIAENKKKKNEIVNSNLLNVNSNLLNVKSNLFNVKSNLLNGNNANINTSNTNNANINTNNANINANNANINASNSNTNSPPIKKLFTLRQQSVQSNPPIEDISNIIKNWIDLKTLFESLREFCLNKYNKRYDFTVSSGKPVNYRQVFLQEQGFLEMTLKFLSKAKIYLSAYTEFIKISEQNSLMVTQTLKEKQRKRKSKLVVNSPRGEIPPDSKKMFSKRKSIFQPDNKSSTPVDKTGESFTELFKEMNKTITKSFEFLSAACKSNPSNKEFVFNRRDLFWDYILIFKEASQCLIGIIKDDENYMSELIQENISNQLKKKRTEDVKANNQNSPGKKQKYNLIDSLIDFLNDSKNYDIHTLALLSKLMKSKNKGITANQEHIYDVLIKDKKDKFLLKITPKFNDTIFYVVYRAESNDHEYRNLIDLCRIKNTLSDYDKNVVQYLSTQLNMYADMCYGRNYVCIEKVKELFPLDHLIYHIANLDLHEEILVGLINILNYAYIDIAPHSQIIYPSMIKILDQNLKIEKTHKYQIKTFIPLDKLNLILCISLNILSNIKNDKLLVNTANINLIFNLISFRLYENVVFGETNNENSNSSGENNNFENHMNKNITPKLSGKQIGSSFHNLKEDVKKLIQENDKEIGDIKNSKKFKSYTDRESFFDKIGHKFLNYNYEQEIGSEFIIFVINYINDFFLEKVIEENIDTNMENKNIIAETFKAINKQDLLTQNNMNYLMKIMTEIKQILTCKVNQNKEVENLLVVDAGLHLGGNSMAVKNKLILPIIKQISKIIDFIFNIKINDMMDSIIENLLTENKLIICKVKSELLSSNNNANNADNANNANNANNVNLNNKENINNKDISCKENNKENKENFTKPNIKAYNICIEEFERRKNFKEILLDREYFLYQLFNQLKYEDYYEEEDEESSSQDNSFPILTKSSKNGMNQNNANNSDNPNSSNILTNSNGVNNSADSNFENEYLNSTVFKSLQELIIKMLEVNVDEKLTKILVRLFTRINSQRKEIIDYIKSIHLIYKPSDLTKYTDCCILIKDLSLLTEKTEIWMQPAKASSPSSEFKQVNKIIEKVNSKFYKKSVLTTYASSDKVALVQTICFSLQLDDILFSLLREICQVYPVSINSNSNSDKNKKKNPQHKFREDLNSLIKNIFKLFNSMVYNCKHFQELIQANFLSLKSFNFLYSLGYLSLLKEIISVNSKFALENGKFIMEIVKQECSVENFITIFEKFKAVEKMTEADNNSHRDNKQRRRNAKNKNSFVENNVNFKKIPSIKTKYDRENFQTELSRICKVLKLVNRFVNCIKEDKFLSPILRLYEDILRSLAQHESFVKITLNDLVTQKFKKILNKKMKILCQLIKIGYNLIQINEKLKGLIKKLFPTHILEDKILILELRLNESSISKVIEKQQTLVSLFDSETNEDNNKNSSEENIFRTYLMDFSLTSTIKSFYNMKYYGCILFSLTSYELQRLRDPQKIKFYFQILERDLNKYIELKKAMSNLPSGRTHILDILKKSASKYFFKGIFEIIHTLAGQIKPELFGNPSEGEVYIEELKEVIKTFRQVFKEVLKEANVSYYKSAISHIVKERQKFKDLFSDFQVASTEKITYLSFKIDKLVNTDANCEIKNTPKNNLTTPKSLIEEQDTNFNSDSNNLDYTVAFTEDFISNIENFPDTKSYIEKEVTILAKNLKSKINFHHMVYYYINNNSSLANYTQPSFHLLNIFLKFIQENYLSLKYHPQITFLIRLFAHFIEAEVQFLHDYDSLGNIKLDNFYFSQKKEEINNNICLKYCQNIFLNNGSVEVFLKIICEGNENFNQNIFPSLLKFFNMVLQGGNSDTQEKFYELFNSFNNSDNLFFHLKHMFNLDIYLFLRNEGNSRDKKTDYLYDDLMRDQLKFLQSLTENHYTNLQLFLREQFSNKVSYNFITIIVDYMNMLLSKMNIVQDKKGLDKYITQFYYNRIISCLETLCEFLQGPCAINQENIINSKIIEIFDKILRETEFSDIVNKIENQANFNKNDLMKEETEEEDYLTSGGNENLITGENIYINNFTSQLKLFSHLTNYEKSLMIYKIGLVLLAIIEGRKTKDEIIQKLIRDFDYKLIYDKLTELYYKIRMVYQYELEFFLYAEDSDENDSLDDKIVVEAGFNLYAFLSSLYAFETSDSEFKRLYVLFNKDSGKFSDNSFEKDVFFDSNLNLLAIKKAMLFYKENCLKIEILKDDEVQTVYFPKLDIFKNLSGEMIRNFREKADRTSVQSKLNSLLSYKEDLHTNLIQLFYLEKFLKKLGFFRFLFMNPKLYLYTSITLGIIMNVLILIGYSTSAYGADDNISLINRMSLFELDQSNSALIFRIFGIILIICSFLVFCEFLTRKAPLMYRKAIMSYYKDLYEKKTKQMTDLEIKSFSSILTTNDCTDLWKKIKIYFGLIFNAEVIYASGYITFAILGLSFHYFFFCYHIIEFIKSQSVLRNVLKSVYNPRKQLIFIIAFFLVLEYFYSLLIFYFFYDIMPQDSCSSVFICLATVYRETFTSSGNLGNYIDRSGIHKNTQGKMDRYILDISFTIIMVWLVFQMISGLIVDTFSSLRKEQEELDEDTKNICFICGLDRETIEKFYVGKDGFDRHLQDHNVASYFCYIFYLKEKNQSEYTGIESYVKEMIDVENISWIPTERCLIMDIWKMKQKK